MTLDRGIDLRDRSPDAISWFLCFGAGDQRAGGGGTSDRAIRDGGDGGGGNSNGDGTSAMGIYNFGSEIPLFSFSILDMLEE